MRLQDLTISPKSLGSKLLLVDIAPAYTYKDGVRTNEIGAYRYSVAMPDHNLDKIAVRIDGEKLLDAPEGFVEVKFTELELFLYWQNGGYQVGARATGISLVNTKA